METKKADLFLTYCTNAEYGMIVLKDAPAQAASFARFVLGDEGQAILAKHGFGRGDPAK
jgi:ABC-type molybdate transport system substrate-binding protein